MSAYDIVAQVIASAQSASLSTQPWTDILTHRKAFGFLVPQFAGTPIGRMPAEDAARLLGWIK